tara:strand:+ start:1427 stop:1636 length:210 start_codon:yes stop_codon:yes gene_type:complete
VLFDNDIHRNKKEKYMTDLEWMLTISLGPILALGFMQFIASGKTLDEAWQKYIDSQIKKESHKRKRGNK